MIKRIIPSALALSALLTAGCGTRETVESKPIVNPPVPTQAKTPVANIAKVLAEKNSFAEVAPHLDLGGQFYLYLSTEQFIPRIEEMLKLYG